MTELSRRAFLGTSAALGAGVASLPMRTIGLSGRNAWVARAFKTGRGANDVAFATGTYDGRLTAFSWEGGLLWEVNRGAFAFDIDCRDVNGDGADEIFAALSDGSVVSLSATGKVRFEFRHPHGLPMYQVAAVRTKDAGFYVAASGPGGMVYCLDADNGKLRLERSAAQLVLARQLVACDFNGSGDEALFAGSSRTEEHRAALWTSLAKDPVWQKGPRNNNVDYAPSEAMFLPRAGGGLAVTVGGGKLQPNSGDRAGGGGATMVLYDAAGNAKRLPLRNLDKFQLTNYTESYGKYAGYFVAPARSGGENLIAVMYCDRIVLSDVEGVVRKAGTAPFGFTSIDTVRHGEREWLLLGSAPNGDDNLYLLPVDADWNAALASLRPRGVQAAASAQIRKTVSAVEARPPVQSPGAEPVDIVVRMYRVNTSEEIRQFRDHIPQFLSYCRKNFGMSNVRYGVDLWLGRGSARQMPESELLDFFRHLEQTRSYFTIFASHGNNLGEQNLKWYVPVALARKILDAAPTTCMSMYSGEDEHYEAMSGWFDEYWKPMMDLCVERGAKVYMKEKNIFWAAVPAMPEFRRRFLSPKYRGALIPNTEDSNSRTPDMQLAGRAGIWMAGLVDGWGIRLIGDAFSFDRQHEYEYPMAGHPSLRSMVAAASLGCRNFMFEHGQFGRFTGDVDRGWDFNRVWEESDAAFLKLLRSGALHIPKRGEMAGLSPVVLAMSEPSKRFVEGGTNTHYYHRCHPDDGGRYAFGRMDCYFGMSPAHPFDLATLLWGRKRQFGNYMPASPNGFVTVVPDDLPASAIPWAKARIETNGDWIRLDGKELAPAEAARAIPALLARHAASLPFHCAAKDEIFFQAARISPHEYQIVLVDPGYLDPRDRTVRIRTTLPGAVSMRDAITGGAVAKKDGAWEIGVPAGTFRILRAAV